MKATSYIKKKKLSKLPWIVAILTFFLFQWYTDLASLYNAIFAISIFYLLSFVDELSKRLVIMKLIILTALIQWLVAPILYYEILTHYEMAVPIETFMRLAVPGTLLFIIGLSLPLFKKRINVDNNIALIYAHLQRNPDLGYIIFGLGIFGNLIYPFTGGVFNFIFYLLKSMVYVGAFYVYYSPSKLKTYILLATLFYTLYDAISTTLFWPIIFWSFFAFMLISLQYNIKGYLKIGLTAIALSVLIILQAIKPDVRMLDRFNIDLEISKPEVMWTMAFFTLKNTNVNNINFLFIPIVHRLNQGNLDAHTIKMVPKKVPYENGNTIMAASFGALIPRFLWPNKPTASPERFERYTGIRLIGGTYMNISPLGESYVNFGFKGAPFFLFFYGLFINFMFKFILVISRRFPTLMLWVPLIFYQVVRMEVDLVVSLNHGIKTSIFVFFVFLGFRVFFRRKL